MARSTARQHTVYLRDELTLRTISDAHRLLCEAFGKANRIVIDLSAAGESDLSLVQLLEAARHSAAQGNKSVSLVKPLPECLQRDLSRGGFLNAAGSEFWTSNGEQQ